MEGGGGRSRGERGTEGGREGRRAGEESEKCARPVNRNGSPRDDDEDESIILQRHGLLKTPHTYLAVNSVIVKHGSSSHGNSRSVDVTTVPYHGEQGSSQDALRGEGADEAELSDHGHQKTVGEKDWDSPVINRRRV